MQTLLNLPTLRLGAVMASAALLLSSCGSPDAVDLSPVSDSIDAIESAQSDLRTRMTEIESSVTSLGSASGGDPEAATELLDRFDAIELALSTLDTAFAQFLIDGETTEADLRALLAQLESTLAGVTTSLSSIRTDLSDARSRLNSLEAQFDQHQRDHN